MVWLLNGHLSRNSSALVKFRRMARPRIAGFFSDGDLKSGLALNERLFHFNIFR